MKAWPSMAKEDRRSNRCADDDREQKKQGCQQDQTSGSDDSIKKRLADPQIHRA